ncbi:MAG: chemotaxis protein CheW [Vulcanimicrobiota bacterium]
MSEARAAHLRKEFDAAFQRQPEAARAKGEELLVIRVGDQSYALRLAQIEGIVKEKKITPLPGAPRGLLGIAGFRGVLVGVYDLASWLGQSRQIGTWLALVRTKDGAGLALAFDSLESQLTLDPSKLVAHDSGLHVDSLAQTAEGPLPVLSLPSLLQSLTQGKGV